MDQKILSLQMEVSGCVGACAHCWASGHPYPPMMLGHIERILSEAAGFAQSEGMKFEPYPMHDVLTHPDALKIMQLFDAHCHPLFEPVTTSGPVLGQRTDWEEILSGLKQLGATDFWFTFHGLNDIHDRAVNHRGAFAETVTAIQRGKSAGFGCGGNVYVTTANLHQVSQMIEFCHSVGLDGFSIEVACYHLSPRLRIYEAIRPKLDQLIPYADLIAKESGFWKEAWRNLDKCTEAHYVNQALTRQESEDVRWSYFDRNRINLVCRNNMDLHTGYAGLYGPFHGNLGSDDVRLIFEKAVKAGAWPQEKLVFPDDQIPAVSELASRWGNPKGQKIHMTAASMRLRWLDQALAREGGRRKQIPTRH